MRIRQCHRLTLATVITAITALTAAAPAPGDPGGAEVVHAPRQCTPSGDGIFCTESHSVFQFVTNPAGNINIVQHVRFDNSFTSPQCSFSDQGSSRNHLLINDGQDQEFHFAFQIHSRFDCNGVTTDCVTTLHFHRANGQTQFTREETVCSDPL